MHILMTHSAATAEKHNMIDNLNEAAERGAVFLRRNLNLTDTIETPVTVEKPVVDVTFGLRDKLFSENNPDQWSTQHEYNEESDE